MLTLHLLLLFLAGFAAISALSPRFSWAERTGFAFPVGLFCVTFLMMLCDWANIPLTSGCLSIITVLTCGAAIGWLWTRCENLKPLWQKPDVSWINVLWVVAIAAIAYVEYANFVKCIYFPTYDRDSMAGFDTIGYVAAQEHTYHRLSIFDGDYMPLIKRAGSVISYLPMIQLSYAYLYALGATLSKAIPALIYLSFLLGFYGLVRRASNHTAASVALLGVVFAPEMTSFSSLSGTNVMQACMASTGLMYVCLWTKDRDIAFLRMGALLLAINCFMRMEGLVFALTAALVVLIYILKEKGDARRQAFRSCLWLPIAAMGPIVVFSIYAATCGLSSEPTVITHPYWDGEKAGQIADGAKFLITNVPYYGLTFIIMGAMIVASVYAFVRRQDTLTTVAAIVISMVLYFCILYQIDYKWDSLSNVLRYSAKRFMFCYVPMAWFFSVTCVPGLWIFNKIEAMCGFRLPAARTETASTTPANNTHQTKHNNKRK